MEHIAWMAWTLPTAIFFVMLALTLGFFGGTPRREHGGVSSC